MIGVRNCCEGDACKKCTNLYREPQYIGKHHEEETPGNRGDEKNLLVFRCTSHEFCHKELVHDESDEKEQDTFEDGQEDFIRDKSILGET